MVIHALVISLPERQSNVEAIKNCLGPFGVNVSAMEAFDARVPANLEKEEAKLIATQFFQLNKPRSQHSQAATPGAVGTFLSYRRAWETIAKSEDPVLVLEDDFTLNRSLGAPLVQQYLDEAFSLTKNGSFDCIAMTGNLGSARHAVANQRGFVRMISPFTNGGCIIYSPRGARILLEELPFCLGHADMLLGFVAFKRAFGPERFVLGQTIDSIIATTSLPSLIQHDDCTGLLFSQDDYQSYFAKYYANPQRSLLGSRSLQGPEPDRGELSIWRVIPRAIPTPAPAKRSSPLVLLAILALLFGFLQMKK